MAIEQMREVAKRGGRPRKFNSPTDLINAFEKYCRWAKENPMVVTDRSTKKFKAELVDNKVRQTPGAAETSQATVERPLTIDGFCAHAGISNWTQMKANYAERPGFMSIFACIERAIRDQQSAGGLIGIYDSSLTARIAGLADKKEVTLEGDLSVDSKVTYKSFMPHSDEQSTADK